MCGICGVYNFKSGKPVERERVQRMAAVMRHRGPDDGGEYVADALGFGFRRLAIIDLKTGNQPMSDEDENVWLVFNGEIYNYLELGAQLRKKGHRFRTTSDTEVILRAYLEYGLDCVQHFNGMFAIAIWDARQRRLVAFRDRVGVKPFYYALDDDGIVFASEVKSILQFRTAPVETNLDALDCFMTLGYVIGPQTMFKDVQKLEPGHLLVCENGEVRKQQYWEIDYSIRNGRDLDAASEELMALLESSIRLRLRSDVPLGVFLSGGIDSSTVVALLHRLAKGPIKTFSVGYDRGGEKYNELNYARMISQKFGTDHHEIVLHPREFRDFIPKFLWHMDEPVAEAPAISLFHVSKLAREHVTVVLSGEGADELFAGYPIYKYLLQIDKFAKLPDAVRNGLIARVLRSSISDYRVEKFLFMAGQPPDFRYLGVHQLDPRWKESLWSRDFAHRVNGGGARQQVENHYRKSHDLHVLNRYLHFDTKTWLPDDILVKADKMSMATSIELRVPFLDYRLVEFAAALPPGFKLRGSTSKYILKYSLQNLLPAEILTRPKRGFPTPISLMFRGELKAYVEDLLFDERTRRRGYFEPAAVRKLLEQHHTGKHYLDKTIWQLILCEEWHRMFVDRST
ncbi:MAG: asparagine synthase (glutamine-hydrolyzing) [bacterium]